MSRARSFALLSALVALTGCYAYRPAKLDRVTPTNQVRVTTQDGRRTELAQVSVAADTMRGLGVRQRWPWSRREHFTAPIATIAQVEVQRLLVGRSILAGVAVVALVAIPVLIIASDFDMGFGSLGTGDCCFYRRTLSYRVAK
jgi:hypothetical protein